MNDLKLNFGYYLTVLFLNLTILLSNQFLLPLVFTRFK